MSFYIAAIKTSHWLFWKVLKSPNFVSMTNFRFMFSSCLLLLFWYPNVIYLFSILNLFLPLFVYFSANCNLNRFTFFIELSKISYVLKVSYTTNLIHLCKFLIACIPVHPIRNLRHFCTAFPEYQKAACHAMKVFPLCSVLWLLSLLTGLI